MSVISAVGAHLWQSTLFAALVGVATLALKRNHPAVRHALWFAASVKFFVPVAALTALGAQFGPQTPVRVTETAIVIVMNNAGSALPPALPFASAPTPSLPVFDVSPAIVGTIWLVGAVAVMLVWTVRWHRVAAIARAGAALDEGRDVDALRNLARAAGVKRPIRMVATSAALEPGIFGVLRPILLWPRSIAGRLDERQVVSILAHEVAHVRRRDNLTAAVHMAVQAIFWFHPLVWWLGGRLVDERERACDEAVVRSGSERRVYAQTILTACRAFVESPLACMAGVTGSDLRKRIERIMGDGPSDTLTPWKKTLVAALPVAAVVAPIVVGVLDAPRLRAAARIRAQQSALASPGAPPQFEVASVRPNKSSIGKVAIQTQPGGRFEAVNVTLRQLVRFAYQLQDSQLSGGPKWLDDDRFDIVAKADGDGLGEPFLAERTGQPSRAQLMLRALLGDRFKLQVHTESRQQAIYALVLARRGGELGPQLQRSDVDCSAPDADKRETMKAKAKPLGDKSKTQTTTDGPQCGIRIWPGNMTGGGAAIAQLGNSLAAMVGRPVFDKTDLPGTFDFTLTWTPDQIPPGFEKKGAAMGLPKIDPNGPSIFTAIQEQLGLKLDSQKGPVDVLVIDRADHPVEN